MPKLYVISPSGEHKIVEIESTGDYFDKSKVLWDERLDGAMPPVTLGKMQRSGNTLNNLLDYLPEHAGWIAAQQIEAVAENKRVSLVTEIKSDSELSALRAMSGDEINVWFESNVTTTAQLIKLVKKVFKVMIRKNML